MTRSTRQRTRLSAEASAPKRSNVSEDIPSYESQFDINNIVKLTYGTSKGCFLGVNAISKFAEILDDLKPSGLGFVCSKGAYKISGCWAAIEPMIKERSIPFKLYDQVVANPTETNVTEAVNLFREVYDENFVIVGIGGGSPLDAAKSIAVLLEHGDKTVEELYMHKFTAERAAKLVAVNLTAGTGSECDMFAVVSLLKQNPPVKPVLASKVIHPVYSIDDPALMTTLPWSQTLYTALDLLNHIMESCTTTVRTPFSGSLSQDCVRLTAKYLPIALKDLTNLEARYWLMYSAAAAGMSFNESLLHATHAIEHSLSAKITDLAHGLGLSLIMPAVMKHIWPVTGGVLAFVFKPILGDSFTGAKSEAEAAAKALRAWMEGVGMNETLTTVGFTIDQVPELVEMTRKCPGMNGLLSLCPVEVTDDVIREILESSF
ncbi:hypothetical protein GEMRC1_007944 [Eukaryota sp. GEM-RC1]